MIKRNVEFIHLGGATILEAKDILMVLAGSQVDFEKVDRYLYKSNQQENS